MPRYFFVLISLLLFGCSSENTQKAVEDNNTTPAVTVKLDYAQNFTVEKKGDLTILTIKSAWKNSKEEFQYLLYPKGQEVPTGYDNAIKVGIPLERVICTSTVDIAFLTSLGLSDRIVAISNGQYVYDESIQAALKAEKMIEIGAGTTLDYERALTTNADAAFVFSIGDQQNYKKFKELGIPPILLSDFMENTPLGRAEWALFVAYFFGKEEIAKNRFKAIATAYESLKKRARETQNKPTVFTGAVYKGTWYIAGGKSLMATFIKDAGGQYLWEDNTELSGVPLDFEAVYVKGLNADYWINTSHWQTKADLGASEAKYADFTAFQKNKVFNYYKRTTANGGSDVFESAIVQPHLVLKDMMHIFHDEVVQEKDLYYYIQLK